MRIQKTQQERQRNETIVMEVVVGMVEAVGVVEVVMVVGMVEVAAVVDMDVGV